MHNPEQENSAAIFFFF